MLLLLTSRGGEGLAPVCSGSLQEFVAPNIRIAERIGMSGEHVLERL